MLDIQPPPRPTNCKGSDPELFFDPLRVPEAKATCEGCWFIDQCRTIGEDETEGLWGGVASNNLLAERNELMRDEILAAYDAGQGVNALVRDLHVGRPFARQLINDERPGVNAGRGQAEAAVRAERDKRILALLADHMTQREVAAEVGVAMATVQRVVARTAA